ncbi:MAG: toprim domain-containing protein [Tenuifilaceae bacterium]
MLAKRKNSCSSIKEIDLIDFLSKLGYNPSRINEKEAWYYSPLKTGEKVASFRINRQRQLYYDYSLGDGGDIIKLGCKLYNCSIGELINEMQNHSFSFRQPVLKQCDNKKITINSIERITKPELINYIRSRSIEIDIAKAMCRQINYTVGNLDFSSIGFQNRSGGWELRSKYFKGATSKDLSVITKNKNSICVFEGFFDMLTYIQLNKESYNEFDLLTMNSLALFDNAIELIKKYKEIHLYLDNDEAGRNATKRIIELDLELIIDHSNEYRNNKDLNDFLMNCSQQ